MRNAYSYIRMSTDVQLKGDSLRRQLEASAAYAKENSLNLIDHVADHQLQDIGVSGYKGQNAITGVLARFLDALKAGDIPNDSVLLIESLDRLSRDRISGALTLFLTILEHGIEIVTLADRQIYTKTIINQNPGQLFVSLGIMMRANDESEMKSKRITAVWEHKRSIAATKPMTSICPAWLRLSKSTGEFVEIPEKVEIVRKIFSMCISTCGLYAIARHLNDSAVPVFGRSKFWHMSYVNKILSNRAVLGEFQPKKRVNGRPSIVGDPIADYFPPIIGDQEFNLARAALVGRSTGASGRKGKSFTNLFSGLLFCGSCGSRIMLKDRGDGSKSAKTYVCSRQHAKADCAMSEWRQDEVEATLLRHLGDIDFSSLEGSSLRSKKVELANEIRSLGIAVVEVEKHIDRNIDFVQNTELNKAMQQKLSTELNRLDSDLIAKRARLAAAQAELDGCEETERQMGSKHLQKLLTELRAKHDDYEYRAKFNNALRMAIGSIELAKDHFVFHPWEYDENGAEVQAFRNAKPSRQKISMRELLKRKKFASFCEDLARRIVVKYKNGAVRHVEVGTGLTYKTPNFKRRPAPTLTNLESTDSASLLANSPPTETKKNSRRTVFWSPEELPAVPPKKNSQRATT